MAPLLSAFGTETSRSTCPAPAALRLDSLLLSCSANRFLQAHLLVGTARANPRPSDPELRGHPGIEDNTA
jgi:hypothetical protein